MITSYVVHEDKPDDKRTMIIVNDIANSIENMIKLTVDYPSKYEDEKVPMLDLKVWLNANNNIFL